MEKKGISILTVAILFLMIFIIGILVIGFWRSYYNYNSNDNLEKMCVGNIGEMSCELVRRCYDECDKEIIISHSLDCRDKLKPYIWDCIFNKEVKGSD
jgi:hypothetical protein